jgi:uncharacterized YccA/Bax inhibitor family protein
MRSSNPTLGEKTFVGLGPATEVMTLPGVVQRTLILLLICAAAAAWMWTRVSGVAQTGGASAPITPWIYGGLIGGLLMALVTIFKKTWAPFTTPLYALLEGILLGALSALLELVYPGIVVQAVGLTFAIMLALLGAYTILRIRPSENFKLGVSAATGGIFLLYLTSFVLSFFGVRIPYIHESGLIGIGFSLVVVVIASLNLVLDFDFIEQGVNQGAPKFMEWYGAFALLVTLIWLYLEILNLLSKLRSRN